MEMDLAPGDKCQIDEQCYGDGYCFHPTDVCVPANISLGADCSGVPGAYEPSTKLCDLDMHCDFETMTCQRNLNINSVCSLGLGTQFGHCPYGTTCTADAYSNTWTCKAWRTVGWFQTTTVPEV